MIDPWLEEDKIVTYRETFAQQAVPQSINFSEEGKAVGVRVIWLFRNSMVCFTV